MAKQQRWCKPTVAIDLDMTLTAVPWSSHARIGSPAPYSRRVVNRFVRAEWQVIIYTCRPDCHMVKRWAARHYPGMVSGINFNPDEANTSRCLIPKPYADLYIDDKAWPWCGRGPVDWLEVDRWLDDTGFLNS